MKKIRYIPYGYTMRNGRTVISTEEAEVIRDIFKAYVEDQITKSRIDIVLSHTCPYKYEPRDAFLPMIDQNTVDDSTERWLDGIEEKVDYTAWLCGHWHIEKQIDKLRFLFHDVVSLEMIKRGFK